MIGPRFLNLMYSLGLTNLSKSDLVDYKEFYIQRSNSLREISPLFLTFLYKIGLTNLSKEEVYVYSFLHIKSEVKIETKDPSSWLNPILLSNLNSAFRVIWLRRNSNLISILSISASLSTCIIIYFYLQKDLLNSSFAGFGYLFTISMTLIVTMVGFSYINQTIANFASRTKEIGIRKSIGAQRSQIIYQILTETILKTLVAFLLTIPIVAILLPKFNEFLSIELEFFSSEIFRIFLTTAGFTMVFGLLLGIIPAFAFSKINPVLALKGLIGKFNNEGKLRGILVTLQFTVTTILISLVILVSNQREFLFSSEASYENIDHFNAAYTTSNDEIKLVQFVSSTLNLSTNQKFSDQDFTKESNEQNNFIQKLNTLLKVLSVFTFLVAGIGLLGLTSFVTRRRRKEIGIRKVLGSSVFSIVEIFVKNFLLLAIISILLSFPLVYFIGRQWIDFYNLLQTLTKSYFLIPPLMLVILILSTVGTQVYRVSLQNPVLSLRDE